MYSHFCLLNGACVKVDNSQWHMSLEEVAKEMGTTKEEVYSLQRSAFRKLRNGRLKYWAESYESTKRNKEPATVDK